LYHICFIIDCQYLYVQNSKKDKKYLKTDCFCAKIQVESFKNLNFELLFKDILTKVLQNNINSGKMNHNMKKSGIKLTIVWNRVKCRFIMIFAK